MVTNTTTPFYTHPILDASSVYVCVSYIRAHNIAAYLSHFFNRPFGIWTNIERAESWVLHFVPGKSVHLVHWMRYQIFFFYLTLSLNTCCFLYKCAHHCSIYLYALEDHVMAGWFFVLCHLCDVTVHLYLILTCHSSKFLCATDLFYYGRFVSEKNLDQCFKQASRAQNAIFINWPIKKYWMILLTQFISICERIASNTVFFLHCCYFIWSFFK